VDGVSYSAHKSYGEFFECSDVSIDFIRNILRLTAFFRELLKLAATEAFIGL
jgi:hypothetical protein